MTLGVRILAKGTTFGVASTAQASLWLVFVWRLTVKVLQYVQV